MDNRELLQFALNFKKDNNALLIIIILTTISMILSVYSLYLSILFPVIFLYIGLSAVAVIELFALTVYIIGYLSIRGLLESLKEEVSD